MIVIVFLGAFGTFGFFVGNAVSLIVVFDGIANGFLGQYRAVQFVCRQSVQRLRNRLVGQGQCLNKGLPLIISVAIELDAMALPQPKVSNFTSAMISFSTLI